MKKPIEKATEKEYNGYRNKYRKKVELNGKQEKAVSKGITRLHKTTLKRYSDFYDKIIKLVYEENPVSEPVNRKRGRIKRGKILCLIDRLFKRKREVCLFASDLEVPFDNNQAERDIRNIKVKTKVSGCFRSVEGAKEYLNIMSFVSTAVKHGFSSFDAIRFAVSGNSLSVFSLCGE